MILFREGGGMASESFVDINLVASSFNGTCLEMLCL